MEYQFESIGPMLRIVVLVFMLIFAVVLLAVLVAAAALPGVIAKSRNHPQAQAVNVCGWIGLPTGILWVVAMVWAYWVDNPDRVNTASQDGKLAKQLDQIEMALTALEAKK